LLIASIPLVLYWLTDPAGGRPLFSAARGGEVISADAELPGGVVLTRRREEAENRGWLSVLDYVSVADALRCIELLAEMCRAVWANLSKQNTVDNTLRDVKGRKAERWVACARGFIRRIFSQNHALLCMAIGVSERTRNQTRPGRIPPRVELRNCLSSRVFRAWWCSLCGVK